METHLPEKYLVVNGEIPTAPFHCFMEPLFSLHLGDSFSVLWGHTSLTCKTTEAGWPGIQHFGGSNLTKYLYQTIRVESRMELLRISMSFTMYLARRTCLCKISVFHYLSLCNVNCCSDLVLLYVGFNLLFFLFDGPVAMVVKWLCQCYCISLSMFLFRCVIAN